jgi:hypothetical protein
MMQLVVILMGRCARNLADRCSPTGCPFCRPVGFEVDADADDVAVSADADSVSDSGASGAVADSLDTPIGGVDDDDCET